MRRKSLEAFNLSLVSSEARKTKFEKGRAEHGPVFLLDPLLELDGEMLDSLNYCDEAERRGHDRAVIQQIREQLYCVANLTRRLIKRDGLK